MVDRLAVMQELDRRGKLPANIKPAYDEAVRRGLVGKPGQKTGGPDQGAGPDQAPDGSLPPAQPNQVPAPVSPANPYLADLPIPGSPAPNRAPDPAPQEIGGGFNNLTAGINDAIYRTYGAPVDATRGVINAAIEGPNDVTRNIPILGQTLAGTSALASLFGIQPLPDNSFGGHQSIADTFERVGVNDPQNVVPQNASERVLRGIGEGIGYSVAPQAALGMLSKAGAVSGPTLSNLEALAGSSTSLPAMAGNAVAGAGAGGGSLVAGEIVPEQYKPIAQLIGGLAGAGIGSVVAQAPAAVKAAGNMARDFVAPFTEIGRMNMAGAELRANAESPGAVINSVQSSPGQFVTGSEPTTFQQTGDMGLGALERSVETQRPGPFQQRRADQNAARVTAFEGIQPGGAPENVAAAVRAHVEDIDNQTYAALERTAASARDQATTLGQGRSPEVVGDAMRTQLETARLAAKEQEQALWTAVDPDGTLALSAGNTRRQAAQTIKELPASAKPPTGEEAAIYGVLGRYGDVVPFSELTALQSRLKTEMRQERIVNGESPSYRRMVQLNQAIFDDLDRAVAQKVGQEQQAVAAGRMDADQTLEAVLRRQTEAFLAGRRQQAAGEYGGAGVSVGGPGNASRTVGLSGARGESQLRPNGAARDSRLSPDGLEPNFDQAALDRLAEAREATVSRGDIFDNKTLAPIGKRPGTTAPYDMPAPAVPAKIFAPGAKSFDAIKKFREAVGDERAMPALRDYAVDRLRRVALRDDGTFDPQKLTSWRVQHADALRAFPALDRKLVDAKSASEAMLESAAARKATLDEAQAGALGRLIGSQDPQDVTRIVGSIFARQDSVAQMTRLRQAIGDDPEALAGLRKSVAEFMASRFMGNAEVGTSGVNAMKSDTYQTFVNQNETALRIAGFEPKEIELMQGIAADLQRANRSIVATKLPGRSNTAQDLTSIKPTDGPATMLIKLAIGAGTAGAGVGAATGSLAAIVGSLGTIGVGLIGALRQNGIEKVDDLVVDALLHPDRARMLMMRVKPEDTQSAFKALAQRYRQAAMAMLAADQTD